ncbi:polyphosphate kinase 2 [Limibaculum sp. M0105]|uniref:Polyphosphate kinase 2 n=1 Tax=Thermohalobaculum xanthum TaxID=2753746 RepID=A0A8J7SDV9_9RHOB|nr:polyphosphate kinase 2 [Thermohalobaculum xanthum]MBK0398652.1 polyphosphate kinase 2 [Thermohalobaculum xanthum]
MKTGNSTEKKRPLDRLDMSPSLDRETYEKKLARVQKRLQRIQHAYLFSGNSAVVVFEGWDAAGKGGAIRRIAAVLDPRSFKVWPISAPRKYYLQRHFLTRFIERLPPNGAISVFDRSWYGRVLVERVENLTPASRWKAAYREINDFERMLTDDGTRIVKLFFHVTPDEQLRRFERRLVDPMKRWKLTYDDFRNRGRWQDYEAAINDMLERTSTRHAPWTLIAANDKKHARITALTQIASRLGRGVDLSPPTIDPRVIEAARSEFGLSDDMIDALAGRAR